VVLDQIMVPSVVHRGIGELVMTLALLCSIVLWTFVFRKRPLNGLAKGLLIAVQVALMIQALVGIKLLDQGLGAMQLYIHYVGGLGPMLFFLLMYWFPSADQIHQARWAAVATTGALLFAVMAYTIGGLYAQGNL
jgi:hypothetical protein